MKIYQTSKNWCDAIPKGYVDGLLNVKINKIAKAEYELLTPDSNTIYYVTDKKGGVTQYLGAVKLTSGTNTAGDSVTLSDGTAAAVSGAPQSLEED